MSGTVRIRQAQQAYDRAVTRNEHLGRRLDNAQKALKAGKITQAQAEIAWNDFGDSVDAMDAAKAVLDRAKRDR